MRWTGLVLLTIALAACEGGGSTGVSDTAAGDVPMLQDAVFLENGSPDGAAQDQGAHEILGADVGAADTVEWNDHGPSWDVPAADSEAPDVTDADLLPATDLPPGDNGPADAPCGLEGAPCAPGTTCVRDSDGHQYCAPIDDCSGKGAMRIEDLVIQLLQGQTVFVKVLAKAWPGQQTCGALVCPTDNPCCNTCSALLFIGDENFPIVLNGKGMAIGCNGNECDVLDTCSPLNPKLSYWVWGRATILGGSPQFTVDGFCPADVAPAGN
jgi:hypothetical protein